MGIPARDFMRLSVNFKLGNTVGNAVQNNFIMCVGRFEVA